MTNEEAIKELSVLWERMNRAKESGVLAYKTIMYYDGQYVEALDMAIKALEQQPCENKIIEWKKDFKGFINALSMPRDDYKGIMEFIDELPVTSKSKTGQWIADVDRWGDIVTTVNGYRCSECNTFDTDKDNYCPNCGAKMESEDEE